MYGVFERQFRRYFSVAVKTRGVTGEKLLQLLERRLDNTVFRLGFASSRAQARQLVLHGHMQVNGRTVTLPSFTVRPGQVLQAAGREDQLTRVRQTRDSLQDRAVPPWLDRAPDELKATVTAMPTRADVQFPIQEQLIVELYSK